MKRYIDLDLEKCSACGACAVACMDQNDIDIQTEIPFRHVFMADKNGIHGKEPIYASLACMHCSDAPCVISCPVGCLSKDGDTGFTLYDNTNCIGCHSCAMACPFGVPSFNRMGKCRNVTAVLNGSFMEWSRPVQGSVPPERSNAIQRKNTKLPG